MPKYISSLSRERTNQLPNIYHRPQEGAGVKFEGEKLITVDNATYKERFREFDNPAVNSLRAFDSRIADNFAITRLYIMSYNHPHRRNNSAEFLGRIRASYLGTFEYFNLCWKCRKPIKTVTAKVNDSKTEPRKSADIKGKAALPGTLVWNQETQSYAKDSSAVDIVPFGKKLSKRSVSSRDGKLKVWDAVEQRYNIVERDVIKSEFTGSHFRSSSASGISQEYADVMSHYETRELPNGTWTLVLIDGTGVLKGMKLVNGKETFFNKETGETLTDYRKPTSYRVFNVKCQCKAR